ncbi:hypothetical protein O9993_13670 [Vibrio lentus]|nr:hypothetical protein [Vibrio lentus]
MHGLYNRIKVTTVRISEFQKLDKAQQTPEKLAEIVNESSEFLITAEQAKNVLASRTHTD